MQFGTKEETKLMIELFQDKIRRLENKNNTLREDSRVCFENHIKENLKTIENLKYDINSFLAEI